MLVLAANSAGALTHPPILVVEAIILTDVSRSDIAIEGIVAVMIVSEVTICYLVMSCMVTWRWYLPLTFLKTSMFCTKTMTHSTII